MSPLENSNQSCLVLICFWNKFLFFSLQVNTCLHWILRNCGRVMDVVDLSECSLAENFCLLYLGFLLPIFYPVFSCLEPLLGSRAPLLFSVLVCPGIPGCRLKLAQLHFIVSCFCLLHIFLEIIFSVPGSSPFIFVVVC